MKRLLAIAMILALPGWLAAQGSAGAPSATLKINNVHIILDGEKIDLDKNCEIQLDGGVPTKVVIYEEKGLTYGTEFTYKKGTNRLKLVRKGYALKAGMEPKYGKQKKDMQEIKTSIPGSFSMRVVENIVLNKTTLESINVSFTYELIYK
jgi:hypothetical protein